MRKMFSERQAHLSDVARAQQARRIPGEVMWTAGRIVEIQAAFARGGRRGALAAFPTTHTRAIYLRVSARLARRYYIDYSPIRMGQH